MGKTAVIVIHGVGEQRPMGTVSGFTRLLAGNYFRSKPDPDSSFLELRRLSTFVDDPARIDAKLVQDAKDHVTGYPPSTVFYEFYWAFHYRDTKPGLVIQWSLSTVWKLFRSGQLRMVRRPVLHIIAALIAAVVAFFVAIFLICLGISRLIRPDRNWLVGAASIAGGTVLPFIFNTFFKPFLVSWAGDAARYFGASPDNPIERQQIRKEGIDLLRRLHLPDKNNRTYDDIVIVGHSLGSVIAYDIIMNYWIEVHRQIQIEENNHVLMAIENLPGANAPTTATAWDIPSNAPTEKYQRMQEELVQSLGNTLNKSGAKIREVWRVRDLITLGCPLTYARFLLADNARELSYRQTQRELPTCPPTKDRYEDERACKSFVYRYTPDVPPDRVVPDQTAPFLLTRWTNLYFPQDPIGGPLGPIFGWGIRDVKVHLRRTPGAAGKAARDRSAPSRFQDLFGAAHVRYWELVNDDPNDPVSEECAKELRKIISNRGTPPSPIPSPPASQNPPKTTPNAGGIAAS